MKSNFDEIKELESIYYERNPGGKFIEYEIIDERQSLRLSNELLSNFGVEEFIDRTIAINNIIRDCSLIYTDFDETNFDIYEITKNIDNSNFNIIYINYSDYKFLIKVHANDLNLFFDDIYFPSVHDIEIFSESCLWMVSINHERDVFLCMPVQER